MKNSFVACSRFHDWAGSMTRALFALMGVSPLVLFFIDSHRDTPAFLFTHPFLRHPIQITTIHVLTSSLRFAIINPACRKISSRKRPDLPAEKNETDELCTRDTIETLPFRTAELRTFAPRHKRPS